MTSLFVVKRPLKGTHNERALETQELLSSPGCSIPTPRMRLLDGKTQRSLNCLEALQNCLDVAYRKNTSVSGKAETLRTSGFPNDSKIAWRTIIRSLELIMEAFMRPELVLNPEHATSASRVIGACILCLAQKDALDESKACMNEQDKDACMLELECVQSADLFVGRSLWNEGQAELLRLFGGSVRTPLDRPRDIVSSTYIMRTKQLDTCTTSYDTGREYRIRDAERSVKSAPVSKRVLREPDRTVLDWLGVHIAREMFIVVEENDRSPLISEEKEKRAKRSLKFTKGDSKEVAMIRSSHSINDSRDAKTADSDGDAIMTDARGEAFGSPSGRNTKGALVLSAEGWRILTTPKIEAASDRVELALRLMMSIRSRRERRNSTSSNNNKAHRMSF